MPSPGTRLRAGALLAIGALALHQLRYRLSYGDHSGEELAAQGHSYLDVAGLVVAGLLALALLELLVRVARGGNGRPGGAAPPMLRLWALSSAALLSVYGAQEWIEGLVHSGHPSDLEALVGHGGWIAIVLAAALGALVAMALRGAAVVVELAASCARLSSAGRPVARPTSCSGLRAAPDPVARFLAARGPPLTSV